MGCGTSRALNVVSPVPHTQTADLATGTNQKPLEVNEPLPIKPENNILKERLEANSGSVHDEATTNHEQASNVADNEMDKNEDTRTESKDKEEVHITELTPEVKENDSFEENLTNERKIDDAVETHDSHVTENGHFVGHVVEQDVSPVEPSNTCEVVDQTMNSTPDNKNAASDQLSGSVNPISESKKTDSGSKDKSSETGSKTIQVGQHLTGSETDNCDKTATPLENCQNSSILPNPESQRKLNVALRFACKALPWEHIRDQAFEGVTSLNISRSLMSEEFTVGDLVGRLVNLKELDLSNNLLGPQGFRVVCLGVAKNKTLTSLNLSNNLSDTDSSKALGIMLSRNDCLEFLDVSGNDLGKDYFSRCVGPALLSNKTLKTLKCCSCGATDMTIIMDTLASQPGNRSLVDLDVSNNQLGVGFGKQIGNVLKTLDCNLRHVDVHGTDLHEEDMNELLDGIQMNTSLVELNAGGHIVRSLSFLMEFVYSCIVHPSLKQLTLDNTKLSELDQWHKKAVSPISTPSSLTHLSLAGCSLTDDAFESLAVVTEGVLLNLSNINLSGNNSLTVKSLQLLCKMIKKGESTEDCLLSSLDFSLNEAEGISSFFASNTFLTNLKSLTLRKAKISSTELIEMYNHFVNNPPGNYVKISSLNLEQIRFSGSNLLQGMLGLSDDFLPMVPCALTSLSLSGCSLNDKDVKPLMISIANGLEIEDIGLSRNRLTDTSVGWLVDSLVQPCSLRHLDISNNKIRNNGAEKLASVLQEGKLPKLSTLSLSNNNIGASGITALVSKVNPNGTLHSLNLKDQQQPVGEEDMDTILATIALTCDIPLDKHETASKKYLDFTPQTFISLTGLGGEPGDNGLLLDSIAIQTDTSRKYKRTLNLQDVFSLSAVLSNSSDGSEMAMSQEEWDQVIGADKEAPAWLQVPDHRRQAVYISNLPLTVTREKLDSLLENDADCNLKEVFLLKDPILRKPNGLAWALFNDEQSVQRAIEFYHSGQAQVYGRPIVLSPIKVNVAEHHGKVTEDKARKEMATRDELRKAEESAKAAIVQAKFEESSARHEYAAQHPAYADGRIW